MIEKDDPKVLAAQLQMAQNRLQLMVLLRPPTQAPDRSQDASFPRSRTFRWLSSHLSLDWIVSAAATALFTRLPGIRTVYRYFSAARR